METRVAGFPFFFSMVSTHLIASWLSRSVLYNSLSSQWRIFRGSIKPWNWLLRIPKENFWRYLGALLRRILLPPPLDWEIDFVIACAIGIAVSFAVSVARGFAVDPIVSSNNVKSRQFSRS